MSEPREKIRVFICDRRHPHYGESGEMTGLIVRPKWGGADMAEVKLFDCKHGVDGCFVTKGQIRAEKRELRTR